MRIEIRGELDGDGVKSSRHDIERWHHGHTEALILDLRHVTRLDSSGLGVLVSLLKRQCAIGRSFALENVSGQPLTMLNELGLLDIMGCRGTKSGAPEAMPQRLPATQAVSSS